MLDDIKTKLKQISDKSVCLLIDYDNVCSALDFPDNLFRIFFEKRDEILKKEDKDFIKEVSELFESVENYYSKKEPSEKDFMEASIVFINKKGDIEEALEFECCTVQKEIIDSEDNKSTIFVDAFKLNDGRIIEFDGERMIQV